jgi:integrase
MASIRRKPSGRWEARYRDPSGRLRGKTFDTKAEASRYLQRVGVDMQRGEYVDPAAGKARFEEVAEEWAATLVHLRPKTATDYACALRVHVLPEWASVPVGQIDSAAVQRYVATLLARDVSPARIRKAHGMLKQVLDTAVELGFIRTNPAGRVKLPPMPRQEMHFLTPSQIAALALAIQPPYDLLVLFAAYTGLRAGETSALRGRHVDLERALVRVEAAVVEVNGRLVEGEPKTASSRRGVGLPRFLVDLLAAHLASAPPTSHVFNAPDGGPFRHGNFYAR